MIAARPIHDLTRGLGRNAFDLPVAALAGFAAAIIAFAIPADLLGQMVSATGLPHLLAAAEPPLGLKARIGLGLAGAATAFFFVLMTMRMLDKAGRKKVRPEPEDYDEDRPRLRRRDLHPDAPVCRPISATRDFGEPAPPPLSTLFAPEPAEEPLPSWFTQAEPEPVALEPEPLSESRPEREPEPEFLAQVEPEPEPEPEAEILAQPEPEPVRPPAAEASIGDLMRRLEQGLARRRTRQIFTPPQQQAQVPAPQVFPEANDDRLQSAIESLQRFAARSD